MEGDQLSQTEYKEGGGLLTANVEGRGGGHKQIIKPNRRTR